MAEVFVIIQAVQEKRYERDFKDGEQQFRGIYYYSNGEKSE